MRIGEAASPSPSSRTATGEAHAHRTAAPDASAAREEGPSPFARIVRGLGREVDRGEALVRRAIGGRGELGPTELLTLQAGVYRYSEAVDLSAKLIDRATSGVKTVIQGQ